MPAKIKRCVAKVMRKKGIKSAWAICVAATGIKRKKGGGWTRGKRKRRKK